MKKLIAILLSLQTIFFVSALDVITLTNGTVIEGEIANKDSDGSLLINLPDGNKRYIMAYEIASVKTNDVPFNQAVKENKQKQESKHDLKVSVYAGYNQFFSVSDKEIGQIIKPSPGFTIGAGISFYPDENKRFFVNPAIEFIGYWRNFNVNYISNGSGEYFPSVFEVVYIEAIAEDEIELKLQVPICVGIDVVRQSYTTLSVLSGPIIAMDYLRRLQSSNQLEGSMIYCTLVGFRNRNYRTGEPENEKLYPRYRDHDVGRWRFDWRFGVRFNHKHFMAGLNFDLGILRFPKSNWRHGTSRNMLPNSAQIVVGYTF